MRKAKWMAVALGVSSLLLAAPSFATATEGAMQLGLGFRYGKELNEGDFNPWGTGLGLEAGYTLRNMPIYLGGNFEYFFGDTQEVATTKLDSHIWQLSAEGGYDLGLGENVVLRPKLGLGLAHVSGEVCVAGDCQSASDSHVLIAPGAKLMVLLSHFELSFDGRYAIVSSDPSAKAFIFSVGFGF